MASSSMPGPLTVEQLLEAVERLSPAEQRDFQHRLGARQAANGSAGEDDAALIRAARARLPAAEERRLRRLIGRSESGRLTPQELADYQSLAQEAQRLDAARAEALAELARRCRRRSIAQAARPKRTNRQAVSGGARPRRGSRGPAVPDA